MVDGILRPLSNIQVCKGVGWGWQTFPVKSQIVNILVLAGYIVYHTTTQFYNCSSEAAVATGENKFMNRRGYVQ